jgi:GrpB-like predicted nucleotidyltransferase (UPF0157 family)
MSHFQDESKPGTEEYLRASTIGELAPLAGAINLVPYDPGWQDRFRYEAERICSALGQHALQLEHIGSTSVAGLVAKPIIDIVLVVADSANESEYVPALEQLGYRLRIREPGWHEHRMLKGADGDVNLHVFSLGCVEVNRMVTFRDRLRTNEDDRELYALTKLRLAQQHWNHTQNYADAKTDVIHQILSRSLTQKTPSTR